MVDSAYCTASNTLGVAMALMVVQLGTSTSLIVKMDLGQNLMGTAEGPNPERPKYSTLGFIRSPPILHSWRIMIISSSIGDFISTALTSITIRATPLMLVAG